MRHGKPYRKRGFGGPARRVNILRNLITGLVKFERIETSRGKAHETQKYAERLIKIAKRGDRDIDAMKIADFWLSDKKQVHKLFKVLGPRYAHTEGPFTRMLTLSRLDDFNSKISVLEYLGNPYPPLRPQKKKNPEWLINVLVSGAMNDLQKKGILEKVHLGPFWTQFATPQASEVVVDSFSEGVSNLAISSAKPEEEGTPV